MVVWLVLPAIPRGGTFNPYMNEAAWLILWKDGTVSLWRLAEWTAAAVMALRNVEDAGIVEAPTAMIEAAATFHACGGDRFGRIAEVAS